MEVIVINDVKNDKDFEALSQKSGWNIPIHFETIEPCQQGKARNIGVQKANVPIILFIGDDIFLDPKACECHLQIHQSTIPALPAGRYNLQSQTAVLGTTTWDPSCSITPVMQWLETSGWQFGYGKISQYAGKEIPKNIQHKFTYTSHLSISREIALKIPFREDVSLYGWEDIEWGKRLQKAGISLIYEPRAAALHHHHIDMEDSLKRMEILGKSLMTIVQEDPDFDRLPRGWKWIAYRICSKFPTMAGRHRKAFLKGMIAKTSKGL